MRGYGDAALHEIKVGKTGEPPAYLRFYLDGDPQLVFPLYEIILNHATKVEFRPKEPPISDRTMKTFTNLQLTLPDPIFLPAEDVIKQVGFGDDEAVLPYTKRSFSGYRLLSEYFAFPYKFLFFDLYGLDQAAAKKFGSHFDILIHLKDITPPAAPVTRGDLPARMHADRKSLFAAGRPDISVAAEIRIPCSAGCPSPVGD